MAEARRTDQWDHTSELLALIANCNRDPKKTRPYHSTQFNPFRKAEEAVQRIPVEKGWGVVKQVFRLDGPNGGELITKNRIEAPSFGAK